MGRISTVDLLVLISSDQLLFIRKTIIILMMRSTIQFFVCLYRDRLVISDVNKKGRHSGGRLARPK